LQASLDDKKGKAVIEELTPPSSPINSMAQPHSECIIIKKRKKQKKEEILVDTSVRRSLRVKKTTKGFKSNSCMDKNCLACDSEPPVLSPSLMKNVRMTFCKKRKRSW
jgi:hypothetical protein